MNIYHFTHQLDELLSPEGFKMAPADDPGLAGLEDNETAWYGEEDVVVVAVNDSSVVARSFSVDGEQLTRTAWPRPVSADVVAESIVGDVR